LYGCHRSISETNEEKTMTMWQQSTQDPRSRALRAGLTLVTSFNYPAKREHLA
jgi:hypothetical protein